jgi:HK97 gp10 family phage protein
VDKTEKYTFTMRVGATGKGRFYVHLVEFGSAPHTIKSKNKRVLSNGTEVFGKVVKHPGTAAKPFMRPALDENADAIIKHFSKNIGRGVEREAKKLAGTYKTNKR